jgi:hypothetical protein
MSLLPSMKTFNNIQKLRIRNRIQQIIEQKMLPHPQPPPAVPSATKLTHLLPLQTTLGILINPQNTCLHTKITTTLKLINNANL